MQNRTPPHDLEAERLFIGQILCHPDRFLAAQDFLSSNDFHSEKWGKSYATACKLYGKAGKIDWGDFSGESRKHGVTAKDLADLIDEGAAYKDSDMHLKRIISMSEKRSIQDFICAVEMDLQRETDPATIRHDMQEFGASKPRGAGKVYEPAEYAEMPGKSVDGSGTLGHETGFPMLDKHIKGLVPKRLTILCGPEGEGKTNLALNWMARICVRHKVPGLFASLEMDAQNVAERLVSILGGEPIDQVELGADTNRTKWAKETIQAGNLLISDNWPRDIHAVAGMMERYSISHGIQVFCLDYIAELVRDTPENEEGRDERYFRWCKVLRDVAKRRGVHVIVVSHTNWEGDLAESKKMKRIADTIILFKREREDYFLKCWKNRFGPKGHRYGVHFDKTTLQMRELAPEEQPSPTPYAED